MIGTFYLIGQENYVQVNKEGTLEKLPRLKWWWQVYFVVKQFFNGGVRIEDVRRRANE